MCDVFKDIKEKLKLKLRNPTSQIVQIRPGVFVSINTKEAAEALVERLNKARGLADAQYRAVCDYTNKRRAHAMIVWRLVGGFELGMEDWNFIADQYMC